MTITPRMIYLVSGQAQKVRAQAKLQPDLAAAAAEVAHALDAAAYALCLVLDQQRTAMGGGHASRRP